MKYNRTKNTARNLFFGMITKIYNIIIPFLMRTAMIYLLGMEYLGLNSLFTSVLSVLNLAELGVGAAMTFSMYKPIAEGDSAKICALMRLYKIYYRIIGAVILGLGLCIMPALPMLVKKDLPPDVNLYVLYVINLLATVFTYWLFAYKNCLLYAHQRNDVTDKIGYIVNTAKYGIQLLVLFIIKDYYIYIIVMLLGNIASNIVTAVVVDRMYPQYKAMGKMPQSEVSMINRRIRDLFTSKVGLVVVDSADTIVISAFLGLTALAKYQNYYFILSTIYGFITLITSSSLAGIGNSIVTESSEKNYIDLKKFTFIFSWLSVFSVCCFLCLYQPFMELWVGEDNLLPYGMVIMFSAYFFIKEINAVLNVYKDASGIWHRDRFRPLVTAAANLIMNLIMVQFWGLYGILFSTALSMLIVGMPWIIHNVFTEIFKCNPLKYVLSLLGYTAVCVVCGAVCVGISKFISFDSNVLTICVRLLVCFVVPNSIMFVVYRKCPEFVSLVSMVNSLTKNKLKFLNKFTQ